MTTDKPDTGVRLTDAEREALREAIHVRNEWEYGECDHGTYSGGPSHGEPYAMCSRAVEADSIVSATVEGILTARASTAQDEAGEVERLRAAVEAAITEYAVPVAVTGVQIIAVDRLRAALDPQKTAPDPEEEAGAGAGS